MGDQWEIHTLRRKLVAAENEIDQKQKLILNAAEHAQNLHKELRKIREGLPKETKTERQRVGKIQRAEDHASTIVNTLGGY